MNLPTCVGCIATIGPNVLLCQELRREHKCRLEAWWMLANFSVGVPMPTALPKPAELRMLPKEMDA